jgi:tRNA 2-thiouridine synthesizing protein A|tara:strand:- start:1096 stop:1332 length:237 start_codon:yes stop_codon:yes gene_type:complete
MTKVHKRVDARGLACPMPILKSMRAIKNMAINRVLEILTTDPGSITDIPTWATATGQELISYEERGLNEYRFLVKKKK